MMYLQGLYVSDYGQPLIASHSIYCTRISNLILMPVHGKVKSSLFTLLALYFYQPHHYVAMPAE